MQFNDIKIFLEDYHLALLSSTNDEKWLNNTIKTLFRGVVGSMHKPRGDPYQAIGPFTQRDGRV